MGRAEEILPKGYKFGRNIMIFVTVGTHEQPFNRLIKEIDYLKEKEIITDEVVMQIGYTSYIPQFCDDYRTLIGYDEMEYYVKKSDIIITHGGPGSILLCLKNNKKPIVVPRQAIFGEHVDNHQVLFSERMENMKKVITVNNIKKLKNVILEYKMGNKISFTSNTSKFVKEFEKQVMELL